MPALLRIIHPAPAIAVVSLAGALAAILRVEAGGSAWEARVLLVTLSVLGSQILTGALNDWADRGRDALVQPTKPIPAGRAAPQAALAVAASGLAVQVAASLPLGPAPLVLGLLASASAAAYNLWLSRGAASFLPYLVSFGLLPLWIAAGVGAPLERIAAAPLLWDPSPWRPTWPTPSATSTRTRASGQATSPSDWAGAPRSRSPGDWPWRRASA